MSNFLFVTLEGVRDLDIDVGSLIRETTKRCTRDLMHKYRQDIRLVVRQESIGPTIEPFIGSASLCAMLRRSRNRDVAASILFALVCECQRLAKTVGLVFVSAGNEPVSKWPKPKDEAEFDRDIRSGIRGDHWFRLGRPT